MLGDAGSADPGQPGEYFTLLMGITAGTAFLASACTVGYSGSSPLGREAPVVKQDNFTGEGPEHLNRALPTVRLHLG